MKLLDELNFMTLEMIKNREDKRLAELQSVMDKINQVCIDEAGCDIYYFVELYEYTCKMQKEVTDALVKKEIEILNG